MTRSMPPIVTVSFSYMLTSFWEKLAADTFL